MFNLNFEIDDNQCNLIHRPIKNETIQASIDKVKFLIILYHNLVNKYMLANFYQKSCSKMSEMSLMKTRPFEATSVNGEFDIESIDL